MADRVLHVCDVPVELAAPGPDDLIEMREPEGDEEEARLVHMTVVLVDDGDRSLGG